jgi:hypothetical protein
MAALLKEGGGGGGGKIKFLLSLLGSSIALLSLFLASLNIC